MKLVSLIIPAYNEVASIQTTIREAICILPGTSDRVRDYRLGRWDRRYREAARQLTASQGPSRGIKVIGSKHRRGKGLGIREGVRLAAGDVIGFVDADNKTPISEFDKIEPCLRSGDDVVIGSRSLHDSQIERPQPWYRRLGSRGFGVLIRYGVGLGDIVDTQCGFKFFRATPRVISFERQTDRWLYVRCRDPVSRPPTRLQNCASPGSLA